MMMMKVTILSNSKGGLFTVTLQWAKGLVRKGCDVHIFFLTQSKEARRLLSSEHLHFHYFTTSNFLPNLRALVTFLIHDHPDVIHTNFASLGLLAIFKKYLFKTPFIFTSHGIPEPWLQLSLLDKIAYTIEYYLLPFVASRSSVVVAVSGYVKDMLKRRYIDSEVIYHGIDVDKFERERKIRSKSRLGYKETDFITLFVGKLHPCKDPLTLVRSISKAVEKNPNLFLIIVGDGELYEEIKKEVIKLNLLRCVKILRQVTNKEVKTLYNVADVFVLPSVGEAFGMTLLEAMASGVPVIASNSGASSEVIGNAGISFNQGDYTELANKILSLSYNEELLRKLSEDGLKRVKETFSWKDKIKQYLRLYKNTIARGI